MRQHRRRLAQQRKAAGYTQEALASRLHVDRSTITRWEAGETQPQPWLRPKLARVLGVSTEQLAVLLTELTTRDNGEFSARLPTFESDESGPVSAVSPQVLRVAIAIVLNGAKVLLVRRREQFGDLSWQFPAGVVKPGQVAGQVAINETLAETGIHCVLRTSVGERTHPTTGALCEYFMCDYLTGEVQNRDPLENSAVIWADRGHVTEFAPASQVFPPVLQFLSSSS